MRHNGAVMRAVLLVALLGFAVMLPACGGDGEGEAPPADEIVAKAAAAAGGLRSFHFRLDHENGTTPILMGLELVSAEGEVAPPDRLQAEVRAKAMGSVSVTVNVVGIGERAWVTNPFTRQWQEQRDVRIGDIADPARLVVGVLQGVREARVVKRTEVDGADVYQLAGKLDSGALEGALPFVEAGRTVSVEVWVGVDDSLPRRARISGPLSAGEGDDIVRQVDLSRFDADVDIQPPE